MHKPALSETDCDQIEVDEASFKDAVRRLLETPPQHKTGKATSKITKESQSALE